MKKKLTQKLLKEYLHYNPTTGVFTWIKARQGAKVGSVAGSVSKSIRGKNCVEYRTIGIGLFGELYKAHRLAWLYMTGEWPKDQIDHEDGDGTNNRWKNLREATNAVNMKNKKQYGVNASGLTGVGWNKRAQKWRSRITIDSETLLLGYYDDYDEAVLIRIQAQDYYGFHENHGRV